MYVVCLIVHVLFMAVILFGRIDASDVQALSGFLVGNAQPSVEQGSELADSHFVIGVVRERNRTHDDGRCSDFGHKGKVFCGRSKDFMKKVRARGQSLSNRSPEQIFQRHHALYATAVHIPLQSERCH